MQDKIFLDLFSPFSVSTDFCTPKRISALLIVAVMSMVYLALKTDMHFSALLKLYTAGWLLAKPLTTLVTDASL